MTITHNTQNHWRNDSEIQQCREQKGNFTSAYFCLLQTFVYTLLANVLHYPPAQNALVNKI